MYNYYYSLLRLLTHTLQNTLSKKKEKEKEKKEKKKKKEQKETRKKKETYKIWTGLQINFRYILILI